ncbi:MAG: hypothetical protein AAF215_06795 [Cyanobacteria bacterium P01_A01_bin.123]
MTNEAQADKTLASNTQSPELLDDAQPNRSDDGTVADDAQSDLQDATASEELRQLQYQLRCPQLPLAVYREVAAHLRQLDGVETGLLPQTSQEFDYLQSQVGGLWVRYPEVGAEAYQQQVEAILKYYGERYRPWETIIR